MRVLRFDENPIIRPLMDDRMGSNINGPSLIRVPDWVVDPIGKYYLYFAHHKGTYIRLAYSNRLEGPWKIHTPGVLDLKATTFEEHIASPDVRVVEHLKEIRMYYHGCPPEFPYQPTRVAVSNDGLNFKSQIEDLGPPYFRTFDWNGYTYALSMPGTFFRSRDGLTNFTKGPSLFTENMRHSAVKLDGAILKVFYTNAGDCPESILFSTIKLTEDWMQWKCSDPVLVLKPEMNYEGANLPLLPSKRDIVNEPAHQLRDPCIFEENGKTYLLYSVAGERGIAISELIEED